MQVTRCRHLTERQSEKWSIIHDSQHILILICMRRIFIFYSIELSIYAKMWPLISFKSVHCNVINLQCISSFYSYYTYTHICIMRLRDYDEKKHEIYLQLDMWEHFRSIQIYMDRIILKSFKSKQFWESLMFTTKRSE